MDEKIINTIVEKFKSEVDGVLEKRLNEAVGPMVTDEVKKIVNQLRVDRALFGYDRSGLTEEQKIQFVKDLHAIARGQKAALIESQDDLGGYLVPVEVHNAVIRLAASAGLVLKFATKWPMGTDEKDIPRYTGADLEGTYPAEDAEGTEESLTLGNVRLIAKNWQALIRVSNPLLADANTNVADWLLGLFSEALANRTDKEALTGVGAPFVGILNEADVAVKTLAATKTKPEDIDLDVCSSMIASLKPTALKGAGFIFHRTVWDALRTKKDSQGQYLLGPTNAVQIVRITEPQEAPAVEPAGFILNYPVFLSEHLLPATGSAQADKKFGIFGSLAHVAFGDREALRVARSEHATVGGKNVFAANQSAIRVNHRHAIAVALPKAFVVVKTAAS